MFDCFKNGYGPKTNLAPSGEDGSIVCEGDSIVHLMNVKECIDQKCFNIGQGGDVPDSPSMLGELPAMRERALSSPIEKAWLHAGGNYLILWGTWDQDKVYADMEELIKGYIDIVNDPRRVVVSSLPFVDPKLRLKDRFKGLPKEIGNVQCNYVFALWSQGYKFICDKYDVQFFDEFTFLYFLYKKYGRKIWSDGIHWTQKTQLACGLQIKNLLGL